MFGWMRETWNFLMVSWVVMLIVAVPLSIWKLVEIIIWLVKHVHIFIK